jgi:hypothetical protein
MGGKVLPNVITFHLEEAHPDPHSRHGAISGYESPEYPDMAPCREKMDVGGGRPGGMPARLVT